jgi:putative transposase
MKLKINCNQTDFKKLQQCNKESAEVWNYCIEKVNELYEKDKKLYSKYELQKIVQSINVNTICAYNKQIVAEKLYYNINSISKARKAGRVDLKYPYKFKKFYHTEWNYNFMFSNYDKNEIKLTTTRYIELDGKAHNGKQIRLRFKTPIPQNIQTLKLIYDNGFYACISYLVDIESKQVNTNKAASIDLGEIHSITSIDNMNNQLIITGRKIREIKQFRNKKQAELSSKRDKCKKGSKQRKKYNKALHYIKSKCRKQLDYSVHCITKMYTNWAVEKGISAVYVGDVTGIEIGSDKGKNVNQKLNQWEYGLIMKLLEYKLNNQGIQLIKVSEAYSSQICPCCGFKHKPTNRNYKCPNCESEFHRDIVGAWNILRMNTDLQLELPEGNIKYLRIA